MLCPIDIESLRDMKCVVMLYSIDIESLAGYYFPIRGININRIQRCLTFLLTLAEGLILIQMPERRMHGSADAKISCSDRES